MSLLLRGFISSSTTKPINATNFYDAVIVGGGMVGFGLAALSASSHVLRNRKILLLENSKHKPYKLGTEFDSRVVALNLLSKNMLNDVGAWNFIKEHRAQPVKVMKIWETQSDAFLMFRKDPLAYIVENNLIIESLRLSHLSKNSSVIIKYGSQARNIRFPSFGHSDELVRLDIYSDGNYDQSVETSLLIGADGYNSIVREAAQLPTVSWDHHQKAIVATLEMGQTNEPFTAWQRFLPTGPLALLPLSTNHLSLVWSTTTPEADRLMATTESEFVSELNHVLTTPSPSSSSVSKILSKVAGTTLGVLSWLTQTNQVTDNDASSCPPVPPEIKSLQPGTKRACFPLGFRHATFYAGPRVALVGDAAHRILPLAGQGVNLGFGDAISLIKHMETALSEGADIGSSTFLQDYTTERQRLVVPIAATMELINLIYSTDMLYTNRDLILSQLAELKFMPILFKPIFNLLTDFRSAGMSTVQSSSLIKNILMNVAITGRVGLSSCENVPD